ncbi:MAG: MBL fold metallo-hydrolase [Bacteroidia bacterium]
MSAESTFSSPSLIVLGTVQDGGSPHIGCRKDCCASLFLNPDPQRKVVCLGVVDPENQKTFIFEATPDFPAQTQALKQYAGFGGEIPSGIFLTHAHIGHYTGLMYLGKEAINSAKVPVFCMPRMKQFLENNGPWSQLVNLTNITLNELQPDTAIRLTSNISVVPFRVPHRDEFSETVGYVIAGPEKKVLFIPDIDKWEKWDQEIETIIAGVDMAFLDATFFDVEEINNRDISEIPHPFVIESMQRFDRLPAAEKAKIYFIHFNHTNPVLNSGSRQAKEILSRGFHIAEMHVTFGL